ncbi:lipase family protein [Streptomyces sp. NBC_01803]|uniref:lipase family protein n=1 Tax=Streptomyces sp. NBC_01803 TaxID=2975946 RepID=UPI002DDA162D|nr:lipase family protein [Streptomyces sp. NBC_01803]WSA43581.1 lipase family protein [Streptomyces sp. NBC_01803]
MPPSPLPEGEPGDLIRSRPAKAGGPTAQSLGDAWQVMYLSTDALGEPVAVTGMVVVPKNADPADVPIVALAPGTHGPAARCAPSGMINEGAFYEQGALNDMLRAGYAVAITDYEGYHADPTSTYMVGQSMGPAVINSVRAAQRLPESGLSADAPVFFRGYSQGGAAAMWAGQLQPEYAPELNLTGVVGGGVPANLIEVALPLEGQRGMGVLLYALLGLDQAYPELDLDASLTDEGRAMYAEMSENSCTVELLNDYIGKTLQDYMTTVPVLDDSWQGRLGENRLGGAPIEVPVFQYHVVDDDIVDFSQGRTLRDEYCDQGVELSWTQYESGGLHTDGIGLGNDEAAEFIAERLAGTPATTTC